MYNLNTKQTLLKVYQLLPIHIYNTTKEQLNNTGKVAIPNNIIF